MSLSFINFIFIEENVGVENININEKDLFIKEKSIFFENSTLYSLNSHILKEEVIEEIESIMPVNENSFINTTNENINYFSEIEEIKQERLIQILKLDIIGLNALVENYFFENNLLTDIKFFFCISEENVIKFELSLIIKIYNKYCIIITNELKSFNNLKKRKVGGFNNLIFYRICISNLKRDLRIHVTDIKGNVLFMCSARACLDLLYRRVKGVKKKLVLKLLDYFLEQSFDFFLSEEEENLFFFKEDVEEEDVEEEDVEEEDVEKIIFKPTIPIALHFKNLRSQYVRIVTKKLKSQFKVHSIDSYCSNPHNGCRPKKIRRVKQRKKRRNILL
jgi:ribosomal protein S11